MPEKQVGNRRNVFAVLRRLFRWAISRGDLVISPMERMDTPPPVKPRYPWLAAVTLCRIWPAAQHTPPCFRPLLTLLLVTRQRPHKASRLDLKSLDRPRLFWTLPGVHHKH